MNEELSGGFQLKDWEIWPLRDLLVGPDGEHHIEPKAMQVLVALASQPGEVVTRESLLEEIWPDTYSGEVSLTRCISQLRSCFSDEPGNSRFIETIPKIGYRLVAPVEPFVEAKSREPLKPITWVTVAIAVLFLGVSYLVYDRLVLEPARHTVTVRAAKPAENSIAVLPFANVSDDPANEYFSDGISEEILNMLAQFPELRVISRSSAFSFKGRSVDVPTIAAKLNVAHVLEGSVRKSGDDLRITAQLIDVETDTHLWSETYDRKFENIFTIQDDIAAAVVSALKIQLLGDVPQATPTNPEAYALYLQGRYFLYQTPDVERAETLLKQAREIDPDFAPVWAELAFLYHMLEMPNSNHIKLARDAIQRALDLDPEYGRAWAHLARLDLHESDLVAADEHMQRALELAPGDAVILFRAGWLDYVLGRIDRAIELTQRSVDLDPVSSIGYMNLGYLLYSVGRLEEAADATQISISMNPTGIYRNGVLGFVLLAQGKLSAALTTMEQETDPCNRLHGLAIVRSALRDVEASDARIQEAMERCFEGGDIYETRGFYLNDYSIAQYYAFRGKFNEAFEWLRKTPKNPGLNPLYDPLLVNLRDDPRWEAFLDDRGLWPKEIPEQ